MHVRIIWSQPGQDIFSYNIFVSPQGRNAVRDPVLQVMTIGNSVGLDRANGITGAIDGALKVRLDGRSAQDTLRQLAPELSASTLMTTYARWSRWPTIRACVRRR